MDRDGRSGTHKPPEKRSPTVDVGGDPYFTLVHESLLRPAYFCGVDQRVIVITIIGPLFLLVTAGVSMASLLISAALFGGVYWPLRRLNKIEPFMLDVVRRAIGHASYYAPLSPMWVKRPAPPPVPRGAGVRA